MNLLKRCAALALSAVLAVSLSACTIPMPGFADYDVSGYIKALLDSSYHADHDDFMTVANVTEEVAQKNNTTTVENAAVSFCNTYGLSPSDAQLQELQKVMKQAFALTKYTVKDEKKVETGYYLEVEVTSVTNFAGRKADIEKLKEAAQQEATYANTDQPSKVPGDEEGEDGYGGEDEEYGDEYGEEGDGDGDVSSEASPSPAPGGTGTVNANDLFMEKVLDFCKKELANIQYDSQSRTIALDILQTDKGELQMDLNQIDTIDKTALRFSN